MKTLVIGGHGYLGTDLVDELSKSGCAVDVVDNDIYGQEVNIGGVNETFNVDVYDVTTGCVFESWKKEYDKVFWLADIDVDEFYMNEMSSRYISKRQQTLENMAKKLGNKLVIIMGLKKPGQPAARAAMIDATARLSDFGAFCAPCPVLYGASMRMRCDTPINDLLAQSMVNGSIFVDDSMLRFPACHVTVYARALSSLVSGKKLSKMPMMYFNSKIEYAHMVKALLKSASVEILDFNIGECPIDGFEMVENNEFSIEKAVVMLANLVEKEMISDMTKDSYFNNRVVHSALVSTRMSEFFKTFQE